MAANVKNAIAANPALIFLTRVSFFQDNLVMATFWLFVRPIYSAKGNHRVMLDI
jgi:hypothetical protein